MTKRSFDELLDRSSLGTPGVKALAERTPDHVAKRILKRADELAGHVGKCRECTLKSVTVTVPAYLSHTGKDRVADKPIDACVAPFVEALNRAGIKTAQSCCGHGKKTLTPHILLSNGQMIVFQDGKP